MVSIGTINLMFAIKDVVQMLSVYAEGTESYVTRTETLCRQFVVCLRGSHGSRLQLF